MYCNVLLEYKKKKIVDRKSLECLYWDSPALFRSNPCFISEFAFKQLFLSTDLKPPGDRSEKNFGRFSESYFYSNVFL